MRSLRKIAPTSLSLALLLLAAACGDDDETPSDGGTGTGGQPISVPDTYRFDSRFVEGESSVAYSGQTKRHILIERIKGYIGSLTDASFTNPEAGDVVDALRFFHEFDTAGGSEEDDIGFQPPVGTAKQSTWGDLGSLANLTGKFPENDADFTGNVIGYASDSLPPEMALFDMFTQLENIIIARAQGNIPQDPAGADIPVPYVSAAGVDYQQLIQKYLLGAVPFSQGADDYMDDDKDGKGLLSDNTAATEGRPYTPLEHVWDEGFGYFGAARDYGDYTDDELAGAGGDPAKQGAFDSDADGSIDFQSEINFGASVNAAKRDRGAVAATDYTKSAFDAFLAGRTLIVNAQGALTEAQLTELRMFRDTAIGAWERAIAATTVHYINDTLQDMNAMGTDGYSFLDHAKHWSEMKGFVLSLQFNVRHSPLDTADHQALNMRMGDAPALTNDAAYRAALIEARDILRDAYGFDAANMGDDNGEGGW